MATGASTPRRRDPGPGAPRLLRPYENCRSPRGPPAHETPGRTSSEPSRSPPSNPKESYFGGDGPKTIPHLNEVVAGAGVVEQRIRVLPARLVVYYTCLLYTSPSPRDGLLSRMPSSA